MTKSEQDIILSLPFVKKAIEDAEVIGTENLAAIKRFEQFKLQEIDEMVAKKVDQLLSVVDLNAIVTLDKANGIVYIGGKRADDQRLSNLQAEAKFFLESDLWKILYETPKELAQRQMFVSSESLADMQKGKSMLYTLSQQKNIIDVFTAYTPKQSKVAPGALPKSVAKR